jgi:hypothetical protein
LGSRDADLSTINDVVHGVRCLVGVSELHPSHDQGAGEQQPPMDIRRTVVTADVLSDRQPLARPERPPQPGDVFLIDGAASVQFQGERGFTFRVIRVDQRPTYDGWIWLHGYRLDQQMQAVERRDIFVRLAGLRNLTRSRPRQSQGRRQ